MRWHGWKIISRHGPEHLSSCECWRFLPVFALTLFPDPMIARSSMQSRRTLSINIPVVLIIIKGNRRTEHRRPLINEYVSNFTQFYSTKSERERNLRREYDAQIEYRKHLQAFIDRWRYNANRAAQAQSKIKILEKVRVSFFYCST
jgi:ABC transporter